MINVKTNNKKKKKWFKSAGLKAIKIDLLDFQQFDFKDQISVGRDFRRGARRSVRQLRGDGQFAYATDLHAVDTQIPTFNDFTFTQTELEGGAFGVGVEHFVVGEETAEITDSNSFTGFSAGTSTDFHVFVFEARGESLDFGGFGFLFNGGSFFFGFRLFLFFFFRFSFLRSSFDFSFFGGRFGFSFLLTFSGG